MIQYHAISGDIYLFYSSVLTTGNILGKNPYPGKGRYTFCPWIPPITQYDNIRLVARDDWVVVTHSEH